jgi:hypothetical protein
MNLRLAVLAALLLAPCRAAAQDAAPVPQMDLLDIWHKIRHSEEKPETEPKGRMVAAMPVIGRNPSAGLTFGVAGQIAFVAGSPDTTRISSAVTSLTFSTKKQALLNVRFDVYTSESQWLVEGDNRLNKAGEDVYGLGTDTPSSAAINAAYTWLRLHETAYHRVHGPLYLGAGLLFDSHAHVKPATVADDVWQTSPYIAYSNQHGLPTSSQQSGGITVNALVDRRVGEIDPRSGWMAQASYRASFKGLFSGDSSWQSAHFELRTYTPIGRQPLEDAGSPHGGVPAKHRLAIWAFSDLTTSGVVPYFDLPTTVSDTYGRSARGYVMGRYRGERMVYGEAEYRGTLTANGLLGLVLFANATTVSNQSTGEKLFDSLAPAGGAGLRAMFNKRSRTNLCVDFAVGKDGAKGVYLAIQDAF